jgi:K+-sensing histidine kinase KdpD/DNA-binding winged helix-turn-helix (wHTH) protein
MKDMSKASKIRQPAARLRDYAEAMLMVAGSTLAGLVVMPQWGSGPVDLLYLPAVLGAAIFCGLVPGLLAAAASALAYSFFFTAPYRTFVINSPSDAVTVAMLFGVALVTSRLAGSMREQSRLAGAHAARNATIAGLARRLLSCPSEQAIAEVAVSQLHELFACNVVLVERGDELRLVASAPEGKVLSPTELAAASVALNSVRPAGRGATPDLADWQFHPVASVQGIVAVVGLARDDGRQPVEQNRVPLLTNLLDQVALALERAKLEREARQFAALRERDQLRAALLASIGEDVKPRLASIAGAVRRLRREGTGDKTLVATVASEAAQLDRYIDNLVDLTPGSDQKPLSAGPITVDLFRRVVLKDGAEVHLTPKEYAVLAELAKHAGRVLTHGQLLRTVWGPAQERQIDYLRVAVRSLRQKLERDPGNPELILNEPAVGYRLVAA